MPLYEYQCEKCGEQFEVMQKFSDKELTTHEKCGGTLHRLISAPALQFKGTGWYITDYAKGNGKPPGNGASKKTDGAGSSNSSESTASTSTDSSSSESKSETKPKSSDAK